MTHTCRECGMRHDRPRYQAVPEESTERLGLALRELGCGLLAFVGLVALLWTLFLLWPA